jgi:hypothetical protein
MAVMGSLFDVIKCGKIYLLRLTDLQKDRKCNYGYKWLSIIKINNRSLPSSGFGRTTTPATPLPSLTPSHPSAAPKSL